MRKRILGILLSVFMVLTLLPTAALADTTTDIYVGATRVTSANAGDVLSDGGTVTYDAAANILTLKNATITATNESMYAISRWPTMDDLNINLIGSNTIDISSVVSPTWVNGIYGHSKVNIKSETGGSLSVVCPENTVQYNFGIYGRDGLSIEGCTVTATTGNATGSSNNVCLGIGSDGTLSIKNAVVTASSGKTSDFSYGLHAAALVIDNSTVTATSGDGTKGSYGIKTQYSTITISASNVIARGDTSALNFYMSSAVPTFTGVTVTASTDKTGAGAVPIDEDMFYVYKEPFASTYKFVQLTMTGDSDTAAAKTAAQNASYANMTQASAADENAIKTALKNTAVTAVNNSGITITINNVSYTAPIAGTSANPGGTNGSYTFTVTVSKGTQSETTVQKTITITATPYSGGTGDNGDTDGGSDTLPAAATIYNDPSQPKATIWLSGSGLSQGELLLTPALTKGGDYNAFLKLADEADIVRIYDVSVKSGKRPAGKDMSLTFDLGAQYAGQSFTLVSKKADGTFEYFFATANARGLVSFGPLAELSPFMLVKGKMTYTPLHGVVEVPKTGDSVASIGVAFLSLSILLSALWFMRQNKSKRT